MSQGRMSQAHAFGGVGIAVGVGLRGGSKREGRLLAGGQAGMVRLWL